jgi:hypothetical protein
MDVQPEGAAVTAPASSARQATRTSPAVVPSGLATLTLLVPRLLTTVLTVSRAIDEGAASMNGVSCGINAASNGTLTRATRQRRHGRGRVYGGVTRLPTSTLKPNPGPGSCPKLRR